MTEFILNLLLTFSVTILVFALWARFFRKPDELKQDELKHRYIPRPYSTDLPHTLDFFSFDIRVIPKDRQDLFFEFNYLTEDQQQNLKKWHTYLKTHMERDQTITMTSAEINEIKEVQDTEYRVITTGETIEPTIDSKKLSDCLFTSEIKIKKIIGLGHYLVTKRPYTVSVANHPGLVISFEPMINPEDEDDLAHIHYYKREELDKLWSEPFILQFYPKERKDV